MPAGKHKSRTLRRVFVRTPGSNTVMHYRRRKPSKAECAHCKQPLAGVPQVLSHKLRNMPKSSRRPERPYGGYLCSKCTRALMKEKARNVTEAGQ